MIALGQAFGDLDLDETTRDEKAKKIVSYLDDLLVVGNSYAASTEASTPPEALEPWPDGASRRTFKEYLRQIMLEDQEALNAELAGVGIAPFELDIEAFGANIERMQAIQPDVPTLRKIGALTLAA